MVRTKYFVIDILMEEEQSSRQHTPREMAELRAKLNRTVGYGDLGRIALGKWCAYLIDFAVWFTQFLTMVAYFIFLANTFYTLFPLRLAEIPLNPSIPKHGGIVGNICPISDLDGGFYEPRTDIGVPMLNIPNLNSATIECEYPPGNRQEQIRHKRSTFQTENAVGDRKNETGNVDTSISLNEPISFENESESSVHDISAFKDVRKSSDMSAIKVTGSDVVATTPNTTVSPNASTPPPPTPHLFLKSTAPSIKLLFLIPLPFSCVPRYSVN